MVHPVTGETMFWAGRMSAFIPMNVPIMVGMLSASTPTQNVRQGTRAKMAHTDGEVSLWESSTRLQCTGLLMVLKIDVSPEVYYTSSVHLNVPFAFLEMSKRVIYATGSPDVHF